MDTGSFLSTINLNSLKSIGNYKINTSSIKARSYGDHAVEFLGEAQLLCKFNGQKFWHTFQVVSNSHVSLLGRDAGKKLNMRICSDAGSEIFSLGSNVLNKFDGYLNENFQSNVNSEVTLKLDENATPVFMKARTVPVRYRKLVKIELDRLENSGVISRVFESDWASPMVCVMKPNGQLRLCGDYSATLNKNMRTFQYPLPSVEYVTSCIGNSKVYSVCDLQNAYLQLKLSGQSKGLTTLNTPEGLYQYNYLPFGISSSPGIFQSFISKTLKGLKNVIAYQDDLLIFSNNEVEHEKDLSKVLQCLRDAGVKLNVKKCKFFMKSVKFLGFIYGEAGVSPCADKVEAILKAPSPTNVVQVQSFLGLCTFYSKFINNFSTVLSPIYKLLHKNTKFVWGPEQVRSFNEIKSLFRKGGMLKLFDPQLDTALEADASCYGLGAVLLQKHGNEWLPVQFASRTLNASEKNYSVIERESLAVIFGCEKFRHYLLGVNFILRSDHKPLKDLFNFQSGIPSKCSPRIHRWSLGLQQFKFNIEYIKGKENVASDFLSRFPLNET